MLSTAMVNVAALLLVIGVAGCGPTLTGPLSPSGGGIDASTSLPPSGPKTPLTPLDSGVVSPLPDGGAAPAPPVSGCGALDYLGECSGDVARWCENGAIAQKDCAASGQTCRWIDGMTGYYCVATSGPPVPDSGTGTAPAPDSGAPSDLTAAEVDLLRAINDERSANGLPAVTIDPQLQCAARRHAMDVGSTPECGHIGTDGSWAADRAAACGSSLTRVNEIAAGPGFHDGADAVNGWRQSSGHHRAIVLPEARTVGVAVYNSCYIAVFDCCILGS